MQPKLFSFRCEVTRQNNSKKKVRLTMAVAHGMRRLAPSFEMERSGKLTDEHLRIDFMKNGTALAWKVKRVGSHQPKKDRNRK